tara:strand:- start:319 stop:582 length:264 start_codon:yes stop_codon:yes gene_type:complete
MVDELVKIVNDFGFPVVMALGMGYFIYFIWQYVTEELEPKIDKQRTTLIKLIDQMRMLDQDQIRLQQKLNTVLEIRRNRKREKNNKS